MSNANNALLNARIRRLDGTVTYINKVNANGYSTAAKGPQIPVKRVVFAGKMLKEIEAPFGKGEHVLVQGVTVKLNKRQQRELAENTLDLKALRPDFGRVVFIDPLTGKATDGKKPKGVAATREHNNEPKVTAVSLASAVDEIIAGATTVAKRADAAKAFGMLWKDLKASKGVDVVKALGRKHVRKAIESLDTERNELKQSVDVLPDMKAEHKTGLIDVIDETINDATTSSRRKALSEAFDMDWKDVKTHGGVGVVKHMGRKAAQAAVDKLSATLTNEAFIKHMPMELKRLIQDRRLVLNKAQIEKVLGAFGLDTKYYAVAMQTLLGNLSFSLDTTTTAPKPERRSPARAKTAKPVYASEKEQARRTKKMKGKLIAPPKAELKAAKAHQRAAKAIIAERLGLTPNDVKRGLIVYDTNGSDLMFLACDYAGPMFVTKDGDMLPFAYSSLESDFKLTLTKTSELDAVV